MIKVKQTIAKIFISKELIQKIFLKYQHVCPKATSFIYFPLVFLELRNEDNGVVRDIDLTFIQQ